MAGKRGEPRALTDLSGAWIDRVHVRRPPDGIILDLDNSESPTHGQQEVSAWNGYFGCTCYHPLIVFNQFGDLGALHDPTWQPPQRRGLAGRRWSSRAP